MTDRIYGLEPFIPCDATILVLGSMPSVASLREQFYYAHKQNRFFKIISYLVQRDLNTIDEKKSALSVLKIGLYDVIHSCIREGSLDSKIKDVEPSDLEELLKKYPSIKVLITNGSLSKKLFIKYSSHLLNKPHLKVIHLPSTSPANAMMSLEKLIEVYKGAFSQAL